MPSEALDSDNSPFTFAASFGEPEAEAASAFAPADEAKTPVVATGWYKDPRNPEQERYWDGESQAWTNQVRTPSTNSAPKSGNAPKRKQPARRHVTWKTVISGVIIAVVFAIIISGGGAKHKSVSSAVQNQQAAVAYVKAVEPDNATIGDAILVQAQIESVMQAGDTGGFVKTGARAQHAHDAINNIRKDFPTSTGNQELQNAEWNVRNGANDLKNSMGGVVAAIEGTGTVNQFSHQFNAAVSEWNSGVTTIWSIAHIKDAPAIPEGSVFPFETAVFLAVDEAAKSINAP